MGQLKLTRNTDPIAALNSLITKLQRGNFLLASDFAWVSFDPALTSSMGLIKGPVWVAHYYKVTGTDIVVFEFSIIVTPTGVASDVIQVDYPVAPANTIGSTFSLSISTNFPTASPIPGGAIQGTKLLCYCPGNYSLGTPNLLIAQGFYQAVNS